MYIIFYYSRAMIYWWKFDDIRTGSSIRNTQYQADWKERLCDMNLKHIYINQQQQQ